MTRLLLVCLGGACGTGARYLLTRGLAQALGPAFPFGTLAVNVLGSFALGVLAHAGLESQTLPPTLWLTLSSGLLGGFTTYATFNHETLAYLESGRLGLAALNLAATLALCLLAGFAGLGLGRALARA